MDVNWIKDPDAVLDYTLDWSAWLGDDTIDTLEVRKNDEGIEIDSESHTTTTTTVWLSGGMNGTNYSISFRITTTAGRIDERTIVVKVRSQ